MSSLIVEICEIEEVKPHSNADRLELVRVKNWWSVVLIDKYKVGIKVVYVPPDAVIPPELAGKWGITNYLSMLPKLPNGDRPTGLRVRASRFRGERSFGTVQIPDNDEWETGEDVADYYKITKFDPPPKILGGDMDTPVELFHKYTDIENIGNYPDVLKEGEEVVIDEKIHGFNSRVGLIYHDMELNSITNEKEFQFMAGSHNTRRKNLDTKGNKSVYWLPLCNERLRCLIEDVSDGLTKNVIVFGEIFGAGCQDMQYGQSGINYRAYDISVDGQYMNYDEKNVLFEKYEIETPPLVYRGPFSTAIVEQHVDGDTLICEKELIREKFKGREGIVIRPVKERYDPLVGRVIMKSVSVDYHDRKNKNKTDDH